MKVIGLGDNVVDKYIHTKTLYPGGNCVNFAVHAKKLGTPSAYMGVFGDDDAGNFVMETLTNIGIDISHCSQHEGENGCSEVNLVNGDRVFLHWNEGGVAKERPIDLTLEDLTYLNEFNLIHSSCYSLLNESELVKLRNLNPLLSFDFSQEETYRTEDYLKTVCPYIDFAQFSGEHMTEEEIKELIEKATNEGAKYVLVTRGTVGSVFFDGKSYFKGLAELVSPVDTMGCGDSFVTAFILFLLENGWTKINRPLPHVIEEGLKVGAKYSAKNCLIEGAFGVSKKYQET